MALPTTGISTSLVANTIGAGSNDVGTLCTHPNINKWSKWKPVRSNKVTGLTVTDIENLSSGLSRLDMYEVVYLKPTGDASSPYRLGDFRNYNHSATQPVHVEILKVTELSTNYVLTAPYKLIYNFRYEIQFKLPFGGEIDPVTINAQTSRTKNTSAGGGYGGITWASGIENLQTRSSAEVFSCPSQTTNTQSVLLLENGLLPPLRLQYCQYNGNDTGTYTTVAYAIEDNSYLNAFTFTYLDMTLSINTIWDNIAGNVNSIATVTNNTGREFLEFRVRYVYTINGGSSMTTYGYIPTVAASGNTPANGILNTGTAGTSNTYSVTCYLERYDSETATWVTVVWTARSQDIYIPN